MIALERLSPDERILALASERLGSWLRGVSTERLQAMIAGGEDLPALLPDPLPIEDLSWAERGILRARLAVPRHDLYKTILQRLEATGLGDKVGLIRRLDGAGTWYVRCMERLRLRVLAALGG